MMFLISMAAMMLVANPVSAASERSPASPALNSDLVELQKKFYAMAFAAFETFLNEQRAAHPDWLPKNQKLSAPPFDAKLGRGDWIPTFADAAAKQLALPAEKAKAMKETSIESFASYYHDQAFSRVPYLAPFKAQGGSQAVKKIEPLKLAKSYPGNHTLDVPAYVGERFPTELQEFVRSKHARLVIDDSNCTDAFATQRTEGFTEATRFMGTRDNSNSQFLIIRNPKTNSYRLAVCEIHGQDDQTRILAILGPTFFEAGALRVYHRKPAALMDFNDEGRKLTLDPKRDRVVVGFQNTVWWQLKTSSNDGWERRSLTKSGVDVSVFENKLTGTRLISIANVYGDEILEALQVFYDKGARRWIYMGTAGALDKSLALGDVLLPKRFLKPDGSWFEFENDAERVAIHPPSPAKKVSTTAQGWVGTLIEETKDHLGALRDAGVQAIDVESRYFAEFTMKHASDEKSVFMIVSDQPLGETNYNNENSTRGVPMKSINNLVPQIVISAVLGFNPAGPKPASVPNSN